MKMTKHLLGKPYWAIFLALELSPRIRLHYFKIQTICRILWHVLDTLYEENNISVLILKGAQPGNDASNGQ